MTADHATSILLVQLYRPAKLYIFTFYYLINAVVVVNVPTSATNGDAVSKIPIFYGDDEPS